MKHRRRLSKKDTKEGRYFLIYTRSETSIFLTFAKLKYANYDDDDNDNGNGDMIAMDALPEYLEGELEDCVVKINKSVTYGFSLEKGDDIIHTCYELTKDEIYNNILLETI